MRMRVQLEDGTKYNHFMGKDAVLANPNMTVEVEKVNANESICGSDTIVVRPRHNTDIHWKDEHGGLHTEHLFKTISLIVNKQFIAPS